MSKLITLWGKAQEHKEDYVKSEWIELQRELEHLKASNRDLLAASQELLKLMDSAEIDQNLGDETDRVFSRFEFRPLRAAIAKAKGGP